MKNDKLFDLYSDYLISAFGQTPAAGLASLLNGEISHNRIQRMLARPEKASADLRADGQITHGSTEIKSI
ncbi:MAG: hypothetical protein NZM11_06405 [Anaerolineales bacterium]|nr:hypothetical protein [Anaerolineales bacterium]